MKHFLSCDWGTSSLRIRLFDPADQKIIAVETGADGIFATHDAWKKSGADPATRVQHYRQVLYNYISRLQSGINEDLSALTLIISGMASSSIGMIPLPYAELPFSLDGKGLQTIRLEKQDNFNDIMLISGVRSANDVMRGEETELIGIAALTVGSDQSGTTNSNRVFIFPGTHSKHITVRNDHVDSFKTYMTGEVFALLSEHSILRSAMHACEFGEAGTEKAFRSGVSDAANESLLHQIFTIRAKELFGSATAEENFYYLSALLIGHELRQLLTARNEGIILCSQGKLRTLYERAIHVLGHEKKTRTFSAETADLAVAAGQFKIYQNNS